MSKERRARTSKAVAEEAPAEAPALTCRNCGAPADFETDGIAAEKVAYCARHRPANA